METEKDSEAKGEDSLESGLSQSRNLFCAPVLGATSVVSFVGGNCSGSMLVAEENGGGDSIFSSLQNDPGLERDGNQEEPLMGGNVFEENESFQNDPGLERDGNQEEPLMGGNVFEENESRKEYSVAGMEKKTIVELNQHSDDRDDCVGPRMGEFAAVEEDIKAEKSLLKVDVEETNGAMRGSAIDSPRKIEVSNDGISLVVEVFGPLRGINQDDEGSSNDKQVMREGDSDGENVCQINGTMPSSDGEEANAKISRTTAPVKENSSTCETVDGQNKQVADNFGNKESTFVYGALVWAKTKKTQLWWPGVIFDPVNVVAGPVDSDCKSFLVKYFGSANFVWHSTSQLRHFLEDFEQLCRQNDSRNFRGAVERAICEIGERVKVEMTCPCSAEENETSSFELAGRTLQRYSWSENKIGASCTSSESQFHPHSFLSSIKHAAQSVCLPEKIKLTTTRSCLWAIHRSLGHLQLPIQHAIKDGAHIVSEPSLKGEVMSKLSRVNCCNDEIDGGKLSQSSDEAKGEQLTPLRSPKPAKKDVRIEKVYRRSGKCHESRERKKSKYLSYPFIDPKESHENASASGEKVSEQQVDLEVDMKSNSSQCNGKKSQKSVPRKSNSFGMLGKDMDTRSSSAEILSELQIAALDCLHARRRKDVASVSSFLCDFRRFAFLKIQIANEHIGDPKEGTTVSASSGPEGGSNGEDADGRSPSTAVQIEGQKVRGDKTSDGTVLSGLSRKISNASEVTEFHEMGSHSQKIKAVPRKRKKARLGLGVPEENTATRLPDLNGNNPASSVDDSQVIESTAVRCVPEVVLESHTQTAGLLDSGRNNIKFVQLLKDVQSMGPNFLNSMAQDSYMKGEIAFTREVTETPTSSKVVDGQSEAHGNSQSGSLIKKMQPISLGTKCEQKKRKRKVETSNPPDTKVTSSIPDLNGNVADSVSPSCAGKLPQKRKRKKSTAAVPDVNTNQNKASNPVGALTTSLSPLAQPFIPMEGLKAPAMLAFSVGVLTTSLTPSAQPLTPMDGLKTPAMPANSVGALTTSLTHLPQPLMPMDGLKTPPAAANSVGALTTPLTPLAQPLMPRDGLKAPAMPAPGSTPHAGDQPDILLMKKNLEMMTSMLEKAGNSLSPEMKTKLETEIKGFMNKISSMVGSTSS